MKYVLVLMVLGCGLYSFDKSNTKPVVIHASSPVTLLAPVTLLEFLQQSPSSRTSGAEKPRKLSTGSKVVEQIKKGE